ncbi:hypothetical protein NBRC116598_34700 [Pseudophaeobacter arcticus]|uniref:Ca2+-binding protein, RTX toxin-related n=1 Tax=Pseudophaeobacter arcticus TaxID=385492 RepID=A0ABQ0AQA4_9RHOB
MEFKFQQRFQTGSDRFDADLRDLAVVQTASGSWLYASNGMNGGLSLYRLDGSAAAPQLVQRYWHENASLGTGGITCGEIGGEMRLLSQLSSSGALLSYEIGSNGNLARQQQQGLESGSTGGLEALVTVPVEAGQNGGHSLVYGINAAGELKGWQLDASGQSLGAVASSGASAAYHLPGHSALEISAAGDLLFALDAMGQGVRSYRITTQTGALQAADSFGIAEGLPVSAPSALHSFQAYGASWLLLAASGTGSLSLLRVAADGSLDLRDQLNDTLATRFGGAAVLEVVQVGDHVLVLAAGADDGISLLRLLPSGQLLHVTSLAHAQGLGLENVTALETAVLGDQLEIYVTSDTAGGISRFSLDLSTLGVVRSLDQGTLWGSAGDDLLQGGTGQQGAATGAVTLNGGAGDDILVASGAGSRLSGGAGADCFVVGPTVGVVTVTDFRPGTDQLDLSLFSGLYSPAQLQVDSLSGGMRLTFGDSQIVILRAGGGGLSLTDLWPDGRFATPDRLTQGDWIEDGITYGGGGDDRLQGQAGTDRIQGLGGDDSIQGQGGGDQIWGGDGADRLKGQKGADHIWGEAGADRLWGGGKADHLQGGTGDDTLRGGAGRDRLEGEAGADLLKGQKGADRMTGGTGADTVFGGVGKDRIWGGEGNDRLIGDSGRDRLYGGAGEDLLLAGRGRDDLSGGGGADVFVFGQNHGQDRILDFTLGEDLIDLSGVSGRGFDYDDLQIRRSGTSTVIETGAGEITLEGLRPGEITADDFLF